MSHKPQLDEFESVLTRKFYVADCELIHFSADRKSPSVTLSAEGCATLVSGDIEVEFNWIAVGKASKEGEFRFDVTLDDVDPDFDVIGLSDLSAEVESHLCKKILAACNWQAEVAECLPKNETELASL
ncbi:MAG TPA: hypothetical protein PK002_00145 [Cellvibrio sp.]|nr:hypothetical protein [Cellvibrio sp.]